MRFIFIVAIASAWSSSVLADCPKIKFADEFPIFQTKVPKSPPPKAIGKYSVSIQGIPIAVHYPAGWKVEIQHSYGSDVNGPDDMIIGQLSKPICMSREHEESDDGVAQNCLGFRISILDGMTPDGIAKTDGFVAHQVSKEGLVTEEQIEMRKSHFGNMNGFEKASFSRINGNCAANGGGFFLINGKTLRIEYSYPHLGKKSFDKETATLFELLKQIEVGVK